MLPVSGYTITYFPIQGRAESTRLLLADQGAEWKDEAVTLQQWRSGESDLKKQAVFGQVPKFSAGDFVLYQSNAILQYLGRKYGLYGLSDKEAALIDMMNDGVEHIRLKFGPFFYAENISFADYNLFHVLSRYLVFAPDCLNAFPHLKDYVAMMGARPKIKAYMESEACKSRPAVPKR